MSKFSVCLYHLHFFTLIILVKMSDIAAFLTLPLQASKVYRNCRHWASQAQQYFTASEVRLRLPNTQVTLPYIYEGMLGPLEPSNCLKSPFYSHLKNLGFHWICHCEQSLQSENPDLLKQKLDFQNFQRCQEAWKGGKLILIHIWEKS